MISVAKPPIRMLALAAVVALLAACSDSASDSTTTVAPNTTTTSVATVATTTTIPEPSTPAGPIDPLPTIPVGPGGVEYTGGADEIESFGPSQMAVGPDGSIHIVDPGANRILSFGPDGESVIDLGASDILSAPWIAAASDHLVVVEVFFAPLREKVHRIGFDGTVLASFQLPVRGRLDSGLSGVMVDEADRIHLVLEDGLRFLVLDDATLVFEELDGLTKNGVTVTKSGEDVIVGETVVTADLVGDFGGLRPFDVATDGTVVLIREDVVSFDPITVVQSVEWYTANGSFLGSTPVDLTAQAIDVPPGLAVAPDGTVVVVYARQDRVEVVELVRSPERYGA